MERESLYGQMVKFIQVNIQMIKKMGLELLNGQMVRNIKEIGKWENNMETDRLYYPLVSRKKASGMMVLELNGLMKMIYEHYIYFTFLFVYYVINFQLL